MSESGLIKLVHENPVYGSFIEIGAGLPLSSLLFSVSGASNTVSESRSLYSREAQVEYLEELGIAMNFRSVSFDMVYSILKVESRRFDNSSINFIWASSFQLVNDGCSHGWIGYQHKKGFPSFFHITLPRDVYDRKEMIELIGFVSFEIMYQSCSFAKLVSPKNRWVDGIFRYKENTDKRIGESFAISELVHNTDVYWVVNPQGFWERLEDSFRTKLGENKPVIFFKGSFNPLHEGHIGIVDQCKQIYRGSPIALMLSINTYQKKAIDVESLSQRIKEINKAGLYAIITDKGMFADNIKDLQRRLPGQRWVFPVGWDTYQRMEPELYSIPGVEFLVFDRDGKMDNMHCDIPLHVQFIKYDSPISSSQIRHDRVNN